MAYADQRLYTMGNLITCLDFAYSAPVIENGATPTWDGARAELNGIVVNTGGKPVGARVYCGTSDGGTNAGAWDAVAPVAGICTTSGQAVSALIPGLEKNTYYCYRYMATNCMGATWASDSRWFATVEAPLVDCSKGLVVHYTCDTPAAEYLTDDSGNGNHARIENAAHAGNWVAGKVDGAIAFDALGTTATCPSLSRAVQGTYYSIAFWLKVDGNVPCVSIRRTADIVVLEMARSVNGNAALLFGGLYNDMKDGVWRHYTFVNDDGVGTVYIDGVEHITEAVPQAKADWRWLQLGGGISQIDDFRIYDRVLSVDEVRVLHAMGTQSTPPDGAVAASADDAEEAADGAVTLDGADLNMGESTGGEGTTVGLRFAGLDIPRGATIHSATIQFRAGGETNGAQVMLDAGSLGPYGGENEDGTAVISDAGRTLTLTSNIWQSHPQPYEIKANTVLTFDFAATSKCEVHGIGMDSQTASVNANRMFVVHGSNWGIHDYMDHSGHAGKTSLYYRPCYRIPIGSHYTGAMTHVVFINDDDNEPVDSSSTFGHVRLFEPGPSQVGEPRLLVAAEASDSAAPFAAASHNVSSRPRTAVQMAWAPPAWESGEMSGAQSTPNLAGVVQEVVDRQGWTHGNAIAFLITGFGRRIADASEKAWGMKPELNIVWSSPDANLDGDEFPDAWERTSGGSAPTGLDPTGDNDGDGHINSDEYVAGTDATDADSVLQLDIRTPAADRTILSFMGASADRVGYPAGMGRSYWLDRKTNLVSDAWQCIDMVTTTVDQWIERTNEVSDVDEAFYRLRVGLVMVAQVPPTADAGPDREVSVFADPFFALDGSGSTDPNGDPLTYSWSTNGVEIATGVSPMVALPEGVHTVTLTVDDGNGGTDSDSAVVTVVVVPMFGVSLDGATSWHEALTYGQGAGPLRVSWTAARR